MEEIRSKKMFDNFTQTVAEMQTLTLCNKFTQTSEDAEIIACKNTTATQTCSKIFRDFFTQTDPAVAETSEKPPVSSLSVDRDSNPEQVADRSVEEDKRTPVRITSIEPVITEKKAALTLNRLTKSHENLLESTSKRTNDKNGQFRNRNLAYKDSRDELSRLFRKPSMENLHVSVTVLSTPNKGSFYYFSKVYFTTFKFLFFCI